MIATSLEEEAIVLHARALEDRLDPAPRRILVDGFNVLHATLDRDTRDGGWWRRVHREALLARLADWPEAKDSIWVAFDGNHPAWSVWAEPVASASSATRLGAEAERATVHCVFVENADEWIVRRARRADAPANTVVVSRDRQVAGRARSAGCAVWTPGELLGRAARAQGASGKDSS